MYLDNFIDKCVQDVWNMWSHYADTPGDACFPDMGGSCEEIPEPGVEVKARSEECLAKCVAVTRGSDTYF